MNKIKKVLYIIAGSIALGLGMIGIVVRGIPTTPFLLLTLFCWSRSSQRLTAWLQSKYFYKKFLHNYVSTRSMTLKQKLIIQVLASTMMVISFILINILVVRVILVICFLIHNYIFFFKIPTYRSEQIEHQKSVEEIGKPDSVTGL